MQPAAPRRVAAGAGAWTATYTVGDVGRGPDVADTRRSRTITRDNPGILPRRLLSATSDYREQDHRERGRAHRPSTRARHLGVLLRRFRSTRRPMWLGERKGLPRN